MIHTEKPLKKLAVKILTKTKLMFLFWLKVCKTIKIRFIAFCNLSTIFNIFSYNITLWNMAVEVKEIELLSYLKLHQGRQELG